MIKQKLSLAIILALIMTFIGCKNKAEEAQTTEAQDVTTAEATTTKYMVDTEASMIEWKGFKPTGTHNGSIQIENGVFTVADGKIESGSFLIDMNSIVDLDMEPANEMNAKLVNHLKSPDFFDVEKYPTAAFEVTGYEVKDGKGWLSGNLTMKEKKNNITFPVTVITSGTNVTITSETFTVDRSKWDVKYGSKSFFDDLGDKFINDDMELKVNVKASESSTM